MSYRHGSIFVIGNSNDVDYNDDDACDDDRQVVGYFGNYMVELNPEFTIYEFMVAFKSWT